MASKPRGEYAKSAQRRAQILEAGMQEFSASGFRGGSIRAVAERVGISQAGLLHHFGSKTELLKAILTRRDEESVELVGDSTRGIGMLRGMIALVRHNQSTPGLVGLYAVLSAEATAEDHPAHDYFQNRYGWVVGAVTDALQRADANGELQPGVVAPEAARALVALLDGLQIQWLLDPASVDMAAVLHAHVQALLTVDIGGVDLPVDSAA